MAAAHLLGISVRTLRNKIVEYSAESVCVHDEILAQPSVLLFRRRNRQSLQSGGIGHRFRARTDEVIE